MEAGVRTRVVKPAHNVVSFSRPSLMPGLRCLPARNGLVNKVEFSWACSQEVVMTNEIARLVILT